MTTARIHRMSQLTLWQKAFFGLIAFTSLLFLLRSGWIVSKTPYAGMQVTEDGSVVAVAPGGPADQAGIKQGDVIVSVNSLPWEQTDASSVGTHIGAWVNYTFIRESQNMSTSVLMERLPFLDMLLAQEEVILGFIFWAMALFVIFVSPTSLASRLFFLLGQTAAMVMAVDVNFSFQGITNYHYFHVALLLILSSLLAHFYLIFPEPGHGPFRKIYLGFIYGGSAFMICIYTIDFFTDVENTFIRTLASQWISYIIFVLILTLGSLVAPRRRSSIRSRRKRRLLVTGMLLSILPLLALSALPHIILGKPFVDYLWTYPFFLLLPISYAYSIRVENLIRFDRILKWLLALLILVAIFFLVYFIIFMALYLLQMPVRWCYIIAGILMIILAATTMIPLSRKIDAALDRFFYGHWYDYRSIIQQNSRHLSGFIKLEDLADNLLQNARTMRFKQGILFRAGKGVLRPYRYFGFPSSLAESFQLRQNDPIIRNLVKLGKPCTTDAIIASKSPEQCSTPSEGALELANLQIWLPLLTSRRELMGVLALGERQGDEALDKEDWDILNTLADQTSLAVENIHLVEALQDQLDVMHQMQQELKEAKWRLAESRERERLELARILHDGPIQDIYGIIYQLAIWRKLHRAEDDDELRAIEQELMGIEQKLRLFSTELRPPALETFGLEGAIRSHISKLLETHPDLTIHAELIPTKEVMSPEKNLALFRIYQEAVRNAIRHAHPQQIWVRLFRLSHRIVLEIEDDGQGFDLPEKWMVFARKGHFGLLGISERAEAVGGELRVRSSIEHGTVISVSVPIETPSLQPSKD